MLGLYTKNAILSMSIFHKKKDRAGEARSSSASGRWGSEGAVGGGVAGAQAVGSLTGVMGRRALDRDGLGLGGLVFEALAVAGRCGHLVCNPITYSPVCGHPLSSNI